MTKSKLNILNSYRIEHAVAAAAARRINPLYWKAWEVFLFHQRMMNFRNCPYNYYTECSIYFFPIYIYRVFDDYLLSVSNFLIMVSIKVVRGATWPRLTGIFATFLFFAVWSENISLACRFWCDFTRQMSYNKKRPLIRDENNAEKNHISSVGSTFCA